MIGIGRNRAKGWFFFLLIAVVSTLHISYAEPNFEKPTELKESELLVRATSRGSDVMQITMFPDGKKFAVALRDKTARIFSQEGKLLKILSGHESIVTGVAISPNGNLVATSSLDQDVGIWNWQIGKPIGVFTKHKAPVTSVAFSPNGNLVASADTNGNLWIWNLTNEEASYNIKLPENRLISADFSKDGTKLLILDLVINSKKTETTGMARIFDVKTGKLQSIFPGKLGSYALAFSPKGDRLFVVSANKTAQIMDPTDKRHVVKIASPKGTLISAVFSPDGQLIVTETLDQALRIWDVETGKLLYILQEQQGGFHAPVFTPDGTQLLTVNDRGEIRRWTLVDTKNTVTI